MVMPQPAGAWTREAVLALPDDGNRRLGWRPAPGGPTLDLNLPLLFAEVWDETE